MLNTDLHRLHGSGTRNRGLAPICANRRQGEQGFTLLGLIVAIFLILLVLGVAAPRVAHELRREREVETIHRGNEYVRAIQIYYRKVGHYPGSIEELEKTNNVRYLRQRYVDPMTGKADWRLIHVGEAKTTVKGFFGQPLAGIASSGLGSAAGMASPGGMGTPFGSPSSGTGSAFGSPSSGSGSAFGTPSNGAGSGSTLGSPSAGSSTGVGAATTDSTGIASQSATDFKGSGGPFVGVGLAKDGNSITTLNEQTTYATWEFIYDPRIEQLKAKASLFGGGPASASGTGLGSASDLKSGLGGSNSGANSGTGTQPSSGDFGSGSGSTPNPTTNTPQ
jgi:type II secretory pathway pseudopilin PulG